jgi:hypothetical protein
MLALPIAFMGTAKFQENPVVLSAQDSNVENSDELDTLKSVDDPEAEIPEDVREMILKMEKEKYPNQQQDFTEDIERDEEIEKALLEEDETVIEN